MEIYANDPVDAAREWRSINKRVQCPQWLWIKNFESGIVVEMWSP